MANELATVSEAEAKLREDLAAERAGRESAQQFAGALLNRAPASTAAEPQVDPYDVYARESMKMSPEEQRAALDRGTRARIRDEVGPIVERIGQSFQRARHEDAYNAAMDRALDQNADMQASPDRVAAAAAAVEHELRTKRINVAPGEYVRRTVGKFRELFTPGKLAAPAPDFVEGGTPAVHAQTPGKSLAPPAEEKPESPFVEWYGEEAADVSFFKKGSQKEMADQTELYANSRNEFLEEKGTRTYMPLVAQKLIRRRRAKAAAAAAAK